jgi:hypothetical protein
MAKTSRHESESRDDPDRYSIFKEEVKRRGKACMGRSSWLARVSKMVNVKSSFKKKE